MLSSAVRFGYRAKFEQFAEAQTTENHMMTTTNALTAVQENAGSSGCCFLTKENIHGMSSSQQLVTILSHECSLKHHGVEVAAAESHAQKALAAKDSSECAASWQ